jgi:hypothetical protein
MYGTFMRLLLPFFLLWGIAAHADQNLLPAASFETPLVHGRTLSTDGGNPAAGGKGRQWVSFRFQTSGKNGNITGGLTNEVARTGTQSLFIRFDHVDAPYQSAILVSNFIPVVSGSDYIVGIWGRTDAGELIDAEGRSAYLKLEVDYYAQDGNESVPETYYSVQPIPGVKGRKPYFTPDKWSRFAVKLITPPGAIFAQITWRWETGSDPGEINGIMYFDDAMMQGPPAANPDMTPAPVQEDTPAPASQ